MLVLNDVGHRFAGQEFLFRHLTVDVGEGEVVALVGPSGSGKSTLLSIVAGRTTPTEGSVDHGPGPLRIAWAFQNPFGVPRRSALDHVALPYLARGMNHRRARTAARESLDRFNVGQVADRPFGNLSGGEAQRVLLARLAAIGAPIALVDEPTAQLDANSARTVIDVLSQLAAGNLAVLVATHDDRVREACTREIRLGAR